MRAIDTAMTNTRSQDNVDIGHEQVRLLFTQAINVVYGGIATVAVEAAILLPAGHAGPAFLVYDNFDVIMKWNRSEFYAISVGLLADRLVGAVGLVRPPSTIEQALSRETIERMQGRLNHLGFDAGEADGVIGPSTRSALRAFQKSTGIIPDGYPDSTTLTALDVSRRPNS